MTLTQADRDHARQQGVAAREAAEPSERALKLTTHLLKRAAERAETDEER